MTNNEKWKSLTRYDEKGTYDYYIGLVEGGEYVKFDDVVELFAELNAPCSCGGKLNGTFGYRYCDTCFTAYKE